MKKILKKNKAFNYLWLYSSLVIISTAIIILVPKFVKSKNISAKILPIISYQHPEIPSIISDSRPVLSATSYILVDTATNDIVISHNPNSRIYPASITKLATALTALNIYPLDEVVSVGSTYSEGKVMELQPGENITVRSLVTALLVYSANDAAYNLALHHREGIPGFIKEMNLIFSKYNLSNTHFTNFDGIHSPDHYSTVYDLSQLGRLAIKNPIIKDTVKNKKITVANVNGDIIHDLESTNELLGVIPEIEGLKTGWTPEAKGLFIGLINLNGHYLISVVANSDDRFVDTTKLIEWAKSSVVWKPYSL